MEYALFAAEKERDDFESVEKDVRTTSIQVAASGSFDPGNRPTTVEVWASAHVGNGVILARGGGKSDGFALLIESGKPKLVVRTGKQLTTVAAKENVLNQWTHLAGVLHAGGKVELYANGELADTAVAPRLQKIGQKEAVDIGLDTGKPVGDYKQRLGFRGSLDDVRVYDGALGADDIRQHAADPEKTEGSETLALRYSFDGGEFNPRGEGKVSDASGNGNDGVTLGLGSGEGKVGTAGEFIGAKSGVRKLPFAVKHHWAREVPMFVRAMVMADKMLFVAGPPDLVDEEKVPGALIDPEIRKALAEQCEAFGGKKGALLRAVSAFDGTKLAEQQLAAMPVFDGLIAANGRLYYTTVTWQVICMGGNGNP